MGSVQTGSGVRNPRHQVRSDTYLPEQLKHHIGNRIVSLRVKSTNQSLASYIVGILSLPWVHREFVLHYARWTVRPPSVCSTLLVHDRMVALTFFLIAKHLPWTLCASGKEMTTMQCTFVTLRDLLLTVVEWSSKSSLTYLDHICGAENKFHSVQWSTSGLVPVP